MRILLRGNCRYHGMTTYRAAESDSRNLQVTFSKSALLHDRIRPLNHTLQRIYSAVKNVAGGINAWAERIDPSVPQY
jgi:hypothetical protein